MKRLATLRELETVYSYEDLLLLYQVVYFDAWNEARAWKEARKK